MQLVWLFAVTGMGWFLLEEAVWAWGTLRLCLALVVQLPSHTLSHCGTPIPVPCALSDSALLRNPPAHVTLTRGTMSLAGPPR